MVIGIYGRKYEDSFAPYFRRLIELLHEHKVKIVVNETFLQFLSLQHFRWETTPTIFNDDYEDLCDIDFMMTIGGDGTFLNSVPVVYQYQIPVIGINSGRLGFLARIAPDNIEYAMKMLFEKQFSIENRNLLHASISPGNTGFFPEALNDITIQKTDNSLLTINLYIDNEFAATYWSDGLIIATPTGSTAYSLGVGGPIMAPDTENIIISPIASHNLTVRPLVISNKVSLKLEVLSRNDNYLLTVDNRTIQLNNQHHVILNKADKYVKMLKFADDSFFKTLRNKLMWGADTRN